MFIDFQGWKFYQFIWKKTSYSGCSERINGWNIKNTYTMKRKEGLKGLEIHNYELVGASVIGQVIEISRDKVKVQLEMDEQGRVAYWFPLFYNVSFS